VISKAKTLAHQLRKIRSPLSKTSSSGGNTHHPPTPNNSPSQSVKMVRLPVMREIAGLSLERAIVTVQTMWEIRKVQEMDVS